MVEVSIVINLLKEDGVPRSSCMLLLRSSCSVGQKRGFMVGQEQCDAKGFGGMHIWHGNLVGLPPRRCSWWGTLRVTLNYQDRRKVILQQRGMPVTSIICSSRNNNNSFIIANLCFKRNNNPKHHSSSRKSKSSSSPII